MAMDLEGPDEVTKPMFEHPDVARPAEQPVTEAAPAPPAKKVAKKKAATKKSPTQKGVTKPMATAAKKKSAPAKKAAKKAPAKKATTTKKTESNGQRGRVCAHAGKKLYKLVEGNPRREGTNGYNSFKVIKDGMTYEQFISKGGRLVDLNWDIDKGNVKVK